mmetsp:Transcript_115289/g.359043  ORF Transcript_115289/g.359043 Transcript_115289/m.359043 type:complete len:137 (-) Transcript_115289:240-650(-)
MWFVALALWFEHLEKKWAEPSREVPADEAPAPLQETPREEIVQKVFMTMHAERTGPNVMKVMCMTMGGNIVATFQTRPGDDELLGLLAGFNAAVREKMHANPTYVLQDGTVLDHMRTFQFFSHGETLGQLLGIREV